MARQLTFDLPVKAALEREDFFVSPANALAVATLEDWRGWPSAKLVLTGPHGAGKTHLAHVWAGDVGARIVRATDLPDADIVGLVSGPVVIEDADRIAGDRPAEEALFHLHNMMQEATQPLLLTAATAPARWHLTLADVQSRMQATAIARLEPPDDALLAAVLVKHFADRQLKVQPDLITFLVARMERSFAAAARLVAALDAEALSRRRAITQRLAAQVLDKAP